MGCRCTTRRKRNEDSLSFPAKLPANARGPFIDSICVVKWSSNPSTDFRRSIVEMIREVGVRDWEEMEALVYCYVALNSREVHGAIKDAFLSVCARIEDDS